MILKSVGRTSLFGAAALVLLSACGPSEPVGTQVIAVPGGAVAQQLGTLTVVPTQTALTQTAPTQTAAAPTLRQPITVAPAPASQQIAAFASPTSALSSARVNNNSVTAPALTTGSQAASVITSVDRSVIGPADQKLTGAEITALISGKTLLSQRVTDPNDRQVGSFLPSGQMAVSTGGQDVTGSWTIEGDTVCYLLSGSKFCSTMHRTSRVYNGQPVYYFRRANGNVGEPTVIVYSIQ